MVDFLGDIKTASLVPPLLPLSCSPSLTMFFFQGLPWQFQCPTKESYEVYIYASSLLL